MNSMHELFAMFVVIQCFVTFLFWIINKIVGLTQRNRSVVKVKCIHPPSLTIWIPNWLLLLGSKSPINFSKEAVLGLGASNRQLVYGHWGRQWVGDGCGNVLIMAQLIDGTLPSSWGCHLQPGVPILLRACKVLNLIAHWKTQSYDHLHSATCVEVMWYNLRISF